MCNSINNTAQAGPFEDGLEWRFYTIKSTAYKGVNYKSISANVNIPENEKAPTAGRDDQQAMGVDFFLFERWRVRAMCVSQNFQSGGFASLERYFTATKFLDT